MQHTHVMSENKIKPYLETNMGCKRHSSRRLCMQEMSALARFVMINICNLQSAVSNSFSKTGITRYAFYKLWIAYVYLNFNNIFANETMRPVWC